MSRRLSSVVVGLTIALALGALAHGQPRLPGTGGGGGGGGGGSPPPAPPAGGLITGISPEDTAKIMTKVGYKGAEVYETQSGRKHVKAQLGQVVVYVLHASCEGSQCKSLAFASFFGKQTGIDWKYINAWYNKWRFTRLYRNEEGDLVFDMDVHFHSGITPDYLEKSMVLYAQMMNHLLEFRPAQN